MKERCCTNEADDLNAEVGRWVALAEHDLMTAEHTLQLKVDCPLEIVSFHAQQYAEKYLKAFPVARRIDFTKTHDLRYPVELVSEQVDLDLDPFDVAVLNRYAVEGRYPDAWDEISRGDAEEAVAMARQVRASVRAHLQT